MPASFDVDLAKANKTYKSLQKSVHPDHFRDKTEREQGYSGNVPFFYLSMFRDIRICVRETLFLFNVFDYGWRGVSFFLLSHRISSHAHGIGDLSRAQRWF